MHPSEQGESDMPHRTTAKIKMNIPQEQTDKRDERPTHSIRSHTVSQ